MNKYFYFSLSSLLVVIFIFAFLFQINFSGIKTEVSDSAKLSGISTDLFLSQDESLAMIKDLADNKLLPVKTVDIYSVDNPIGVAVFIPQTHKNPGTGNADSINDSAEAAQAEIYSTLKFLHDQAGINFIMVEGEEFGLVSDDEIDKVAQKMAIRDDIAADILKLKNELSRNKDLAMNGQVEVTDLEKAVASLDREILLKGAPYKLRAEDRTLVMYGAENPETYDECAGIVRNYVYQRDQMQKVQSSPGALARSDSSNSTADLLARLKESGDQTANSDLSASLYEQIDQLKTKLKSLNLSALFMPMGDLLDLGKLKELLTQRGENRDAAAILEQEAAELKAVGQISNNPEVVAIADNLENSCQALEDVNKVQVNDAQAGPSRSDNPYGHIQNADELQGLMTETENQIQANVIDKRNVETARNFKNILEQNGEEVGVLQFGAGHEEGLVAELNKLDISVLVIKTDEIVRRELVDKE